MNSSIISDRTKKSQINIFLNDEKSCLELKQSNSIHNSEYNPMGQQSDIVSNPLICQNDVYKSQQQPISIEVFSEVSIKNVLGRKKAQSLLLNRLNLTRQKQFTQQIHQQENQEIRCSRNTQIIQPNQINDLFQNPQVQSQKDKQLDFNAKEQLTQRSALSQDQTHQTDHQQIHSLNQDDQKLHILKTLPLDFSSLNKNEDSIGNEKKEITVFNPPPPPPLLAPPPPQLTSKRTKRNTIQLDSINIVEGTVWQNKPDQMSASISVDFLNVNDIFAPTLIVNKVIKPVQKPPIEKFTFLQDPKKIQNIKIMLMRFKKLSLNDLREDIINLNPQTTSIENCQRLLQFIPSIEEIGSIKNYTASIDQLDSPSRFLHTISSIPLYKERLQNIIFVNNFQEIYDNVIELIKKLNNSCNVLRSNQNFMKFLAAALKLVNKMNEGTQDGQADGFKISALNQLYTLKTNKPGETLLSYFIEQIYDQGKQIMFGFTKEFECFKETPDIVYLDQELHLLRTGINLIQQNLVEARNLNDLKFINVFQQWFDQYQNPINTLIKNVDDGKKFVKDTIRYFGENEQFINKKTPIEFFTIITELVEQIKKIEMAIQRKSKK